MISPIKVAHITTVDMSLRYLLLNQLHSIQQAGCEVVGISSSGPDVTFIEAAGIRHIPVYMTRNITPFADLVSLWQLYRTIRREHFTIVHTHNPKPGLLGQLAARLAGVPIVVNTVHGFYFHDYMHPGWRRFYITLEKIAAFCSDVILFQNKEDMHTAVQKGICPPTKVRYLGNGIDLTRFNPDSYPAEAVAMRRKELGIPDNVSVIGFVGRLAAKRKGFLDFLAAGKLVAEHQNDVRFLIVGEADPEKSDAVKPSIARHYGIAERCLFLGKLPNEELPILYRLMDVLVLPSLFEGLSRAVMEASAMRVPTVVTDVKGNREAVEAGRNGYLVPLRDVHALAQAIESILADHNRALRMGQKGRRIATERFDERLVFERVLSNYSTLLKRKGLS